MQEQPNKKIKKVLNETAKNIVDYLVPEIYCLDNKQDLFKKIKKEISWIERIDSHKNIPINSRRKILLVSGDFDYINQISNEVDLKETTIILCQNNFNKEGHELKIKNTLCLRLTNPSVKKIILHLQALLIVQESLIFYNNEKTLFTCKDWHNETLVELINSIYSKKPVKVLLNELELSYSWYLFLFSNVPDRIRPQFITKKSQLSTLKNKFLFISSNEDIFKENYSHQLIFFTTNKKLFNSKELENFDSFDLSNWNENSDDQFIKQYLSSLLVSQKLENIPFCSVNENTSYPLSEMVQDLLNNNVPVSYDFPKDFKDFIEKNNRLSLNKILLELEYNVLNSLKIKAGKVKGTALASGIKLGTLHKKIERFNKGLKN